MQKYKLILIIITTLLITSCNSTEPDDSSSFNNSNRILFTRQDTESGISQIYSIKPNGTDLRRITNDEFSYSQVRWSPDGTKIAGTTDENSTTAGQHMFVMDADGSNKTLLPYGHSVAWSPDGKKLAFSHPPRAELYDKSQYIYTINIDGSEQEQITDSLGAIDQSPVWSIDGQIIYFQRILTSSEIFKFDFSNNSITQITSNSEGINCSGISPDNSKLAISYQTANITILDLQTRKIDVLKDYYENNGFGDYKPRWSPNGEYLVFYSAFNINEPSFELYTIKSDGSELKKITNLDYTVYPNWCW